MSYVRVHICIAIAIYDASSSRSFFFLDLDLDLCMCALIDMHGLIGRKFKYFSNLITDPCAVSNYAIFEPTYTMIG